jgi:polysaccharide export outer membrane protein
MTLLDVMIVVGGITDFAAGNRASILRTVGGKKEQLGVRLRDLLRVGDLTANVAMRPGDVLIIRRASSSAFWPRLWREIGGSRRNFQ